MGYPDIIDQISFKNWSNFVTNWWKYQLVAISLRPCAGRSFLIDHFHSKFLSDRVKFTTWTSNMSSNFYPLTSNLLTTFQISILLCKQKMYDDAKSKKIKMLWRGYCFVVRGRGSGLVSAHIEYHITYFVQHARQQTCPTHNIMNPQTFCDFVFLHQIKHRSFFIFRLLLLWRHWTIS